MRNFYSALMILAVMGVSMAFVNSDNWFVLKVKNYTIDFPKKPKYTSRIVNTKVGELKLNIYSYEPSENDDNVAYVINETEYPEGSIFDFRTSVDGVVNGVHGKLISESIIEMDGFPGREIKVDFKEGLAVIKVRIYQVNNKMYMLQTITPTENDFNKSINRFMDSFKLKKQ